MTLRALLLDVDGTVADTETHGHRPAYNRAFRRLGLNFRWGPKLYRRLLQLPGGRERLHYYLQHYHPDLGEHDELAHNDPEQWVALVHETKSRYFRRFLRKGEVPLRPGVARLIREAQAAGIRVALVTNASRASLRPILRYGLGEELSSRIELIVSSEHVKHKKPAPDPYLFALTRLGLQPHECVAVEDSAMGLRAATAAHIPTVITVNDNTSGEDFSAALLVLDNLGEPDAPAAVIRGRLQGACLHLSDLQQIARATAKAA